METEDVCDEPVVDIDGNDKKNPLAVVEYIDDIYSYYKKVEVVNNFHYTCFLSVNFELILVTKLDRFSVSLHLIIFWF